jgi:chaperonin GroEL
MAKQIMFDDEARQKVRVGIGKLSRTVRVTLGPGGRHVILQ